jgi:DNA-binding MarR family transcriptional regulator
MIRQTAALIVGFSLILSLSASAQKKEEKPKVHADFQFGTYPTSREAAELMKSDEAKLVVVGYHEGWSIDKIAKNLKVPSSGLTKASDKLEEERLVGSRGDDYDFRPAFPVIRERDWDRVKDSLQKHTQEFSKLLQDHWGEIEQMVSSLEGSRSLPKERVLYETVVSGILLGGLVDSLYGDKTLLPPPPRRGKMDHYYAWLVESNPAAVGKLKRELRESAAFRIVSIGPELPEARLDVGDLRGNASVYDGEEARRYRSFIGVFSRDKLLPFFKSRRSEFLKLSSMMSSGRYIAFAEFFAWYYNLIVNGTADELVGAHRIAPPEKSYTYAVRVPEQ